MKIWIKHKMTKILMTGGLLMFLTALPVFASESEEGSLLSVTEEAQILPIEDGSGNYLLKSDGFYCLHADGTKHTQPAVHYFDHAFVDGTILDGFYYHDESGKWKGTNSYLTKLNQLVCGEQVFDGIYMVNNLGKLSATRQVRFLNGQQVEGVTFQGYYYFDANGKLNTSGSIQELQMIAEGRVFDGCYYFGKANGVLWESGTTPEGFSIDENGKVAEVGALGMNALEKHLESMLETYDGEWSVYVKNLNTAEAFSIDSRSMSSASLIKLFLLAKTYQDMDTVLKNTGVRMNLPQEDAAVAKRVNDLLYNMITVSDNESYNELVRLQAENYDFLEGAKLSNAYLESQGYQDTSVQHSLHPSSTAEIGLGDVNKTSVEECGKLLEQIFFGQCVSEEASKAMLDLLLNQDITWKLPQVIPEGIQVANKTGENDQSEHDIAIVYGPKITYILCIMSENWSNKDEAVFHIRDISSAVYNYLNY